MFFDPLYLLLVAPGFLLGLYAQWMVKSRFTHFSEVPNQTGLTGAEVAARILQDYQVAGVSIEPVQGTLSDHYDPTAKALRLSQDVYYGRSIAACGVAAHEVGHAIQDATDYPWLRMRSNIVPVLRFASPAAMPIFFVGLLLSSFGTALGRPVMWVGLVLFTAVVVFQLVTLPVEFDASRRALVAVDRGGLIAGETGGAKKVLNAAALTYVAAAVSSISTLLYYVIRSGLLGDRR